MQTLDQALSESGLNELVDAGSNAAAAATPEVAATETETAEAPETTTEAAGNDDEATGTEEERVGEVLQRLRQEHPPEVVDRIHQTLNAELQRGITPKLQRLSELETQFQHYQGISPEQAQWFNYVNNLALTAPSQAAALLKAEVERLEAGGEQRGAQPDPYADMEFESDAVRAMAQELRDLKQFKQEITLDRNRSEFERAFSELEKQVGEIPFEERNAVLQAMARERAPAGTARRFWLDMFGIDKLQQRARNETAQTMQRKANLSPSPSGLANRSAPVVPDVGSMKLDDALTNIFGSNE